MTFRVSQLSKNQLGHLWAESTRGGLGRKWELGIILPLSKGLLRALISSGHVRGLLNIPLVPALLFGSWGPVTDQSD